MSKEDNYVLTNSIRTYFEVNIDIPFDQAAEMFRRNGGILTLGMQLVESVLIVHFNNFTADPDINFDGQYDDLANKSIASLNGYPLRMVAILPLQATTINLMQEGELSPYRIRFVFRGRSFSALSQPDPEKEAMKEFQWWVTEVLHVKRGRQAKSLDLCYSILSNGPLTRAGRLRYRHLTDNSSRDPFLITNTGITVKSNVIRAIVLKGIGCVRVAFRRNHKDENSYDVLSNDGSDELAETAFRDLYPTVESDVITIGDDNSDVGLSTSNPRSWFILTGNLYGPNTFPDIIKRRGIVSINYTITHTGSAFRFCKIMLDDEGTTKNFVSSITNAHDSASPPKEAKMTLRSTDRDTCRPSPSGLYNNISVRKYCDEQQQNEMSAIDILDDTSGRLKKAFPSPTSSSLRRATWSPIPLIDLASDDDDLIQD